MTENLIKKKNHRRVFSILSFIAAICSVIFLPLCIMNMAISISVYKGNPQLFEIAFIGVHISCIIGIIMTILSFVMKEPLTGFKGIGAILNIPLFLLGVGTYLYLFSL